MIDKKRLELVLSTAEGMGLKAKLLNDQGLVSIETNGKEVYLFHKTSNPNTQMATWLADNKYVARVIFERQGLPNIPFCCPVSNLEATDFLSEHGKIICKPVKGGHSQNVHLVTSKDELGKLDLSQCILEKFIEGQEVRLLVVGGEVKAVHHKVYDGPINNPDTVRRVSIEKNQWDEQLVGLAVKAAQALGLKFTAVDFLVTTHNEAYMLEINSAPGLDRFQRPDEGPSLNIMKLYLEQIIDNYS
ncbi:MAG TPA: ATP-grasp domain-containing protein [Candidatus Saccharimonadia bacterium]|nr:ATP-grasp domain-containing protein [Candidatus Saccharimonadia bacterium]